MGVARGNSLIHTLITFSNNMDSEKASVPPNSLIMMINGTIIIAISIYLEGGG